MHLGSFRNSMKLGAKRGELVRKSLCHDVTPGFFTTNAPNPLNWTINSCFGAFHSVLVHLGSFHNCMKLGAKQGALLQLLQKFVHQVTSGFFATNATNPPHWTLYQCFGAFRSIWVHLGSFRKCRKVGAKHTELVQLIQKFLPRSHVVIFCNERT